MRSFSTPVLSAITLYSMFSLTFMLSMYLLMTDKSILFDWMIIKTFSSSINLSIILDPYGTLFSSVVLFISANVMIFAHSYMSGDPFISRFTHIVILFIASMNLLVYIPNLIALLLGWDGLGIVSFLLVIYYQNPKSLAAGMITALTNRIGDVLILLSIAWILNQGQWNMMFFSSTSYNKLIILFLMVAAMTKSAQMPFSSWLPAAMAAPTPVSALVHSSTLVTAGVFLLIRFYPFLHSFSVFNQSLLIIAVTTCLMAGLSANFECDMKKIIALSTLSQLGVMMTSIGLGYPLFALFHLLTHALFKALLFLCAGTLIHLHLHSQDLRFMGNINMSMPSISSALTIANLALCGAPFLAGFYSKDLILEMSLFNPTNMMILFIFFFATGLTVSYTSRFLVSVLWAPTNISPMNSIKDNDPYCSFSTWVLSLGAIAGGAMINWIIVTPYLEPFLPIQLKLLTILVSLLGLITGLYLATTIGVNSSYLINLNNLNYASCMMWFLTPISSQKAMKGPLFFSHWITKNMDHGWEELMMGQGAFNSMVTSSNMSINYQDNSITSFMTTIMCMAFMLIIFY